MLVFMLPRVLSRVSRFPACLWGKLRNMSFSKVSTQVLMLFCVAGAALCDIPTCLITCRKSFFVAGAILLRRFHKMSCSCRGRCSMLKISVVIFVAGAALHTPRSTLHTLHSTLYTSHSTLGTLYSPLYTSYSTLCTPHSTLYTSHSTLRIPHSTLYTPHSTLHTLQSKLHTLHFTLYTPHFTRHTDFTFHTLHSALCTLHFTF